MKKFKIFTCILMAIFLLASCSENPGTTTMKLMLTTDAAQNSRTLLPSDSSLMDVTKYTISGKGPNGKIFTRNTDSSSVEIEGLTIGDWVVTAKGLNREGTELVSGTLTFRLTATPKPETIVLDTLVGTGTFRFVMDWSLCDVANPNMEVYLTGPDMTANEVSLPVTLNTDAKTATVSEVLASGSYKVRAILKDGQQQVAGLVEAVRITNGGSTSGEYVFHFSELGPDTLMYIKDATGTPIRGSLSVQDEPETFLDGSSYLFKFTFSDPENVKTDGLTLDWYFDGISVLKQSSLTSSGSSFQKTVGAGVHRVDAVVYNKLQGSTGSASYTFTVLPDGEVGEMALVNSDAGLNLSTLYSDIIISPLPEDMFLVVVPDTAKMYVCTVASKALQVAKTYTEANFPWLGQTKHVFSDSRTNFFVATDNMDGKENMTWLSFNPTNKTITAVENMRYQGNVEGEVNITNITAAAFNPRGWIYVCDTGDLDHVFQVTETSVSWAGTTEKRSSIYYNVSSIDCSPNGSFAVSTSLSSAKYISASITDYGSYVALFESGEASSAASKIKYVNSQTVVASNSSGFTSFKAISSASHTKYKTFDMGVVDMEADGRNYFYIADNGKRLVSFEATGHEISQLGTTTLESNILDICLSGKYLLALTQDLKLALFEVIE